MDKDRLHLERFKQKEGADEQILIKRLHQLSMPSRQQDASRINYISGKGIRHVPECILKMEKRFSKFIIQTALIQKLIEK